MNLSRLEELATELFINNVRKIDGKLLTPLDWNDYQKTAQKNHQAESASNKELYDSLVFVAEAIKRDGGITEEVYEAHKYAINSTARDLVDLRVWGSGLSGNCIKEDREGKKASPEQIARFPEDYTSSQIREGHVNIRDTPEKLSDWEGTLFQTEYDESGVLTTYRFFHQAHRNTLVVKSVDLDDLQAAVVSFVQQYSDPVPEIPYPFPCPKSLYEDKVNEFNKEFGPYLKVVDIKDRTMVQFHDNPEKLAHLVGEHTASISVREGPLTYSLASGAPHYAYLDLFIPEHCQTPIIFNAEEHHDQPTVVHPLMFPEFVIDVMKTYVQAKTQ